MIVEVGRFRIDRCRAMEFEPVAEDIRAAFARQRLVLDTFMVAPPEVFYLSLDDVRQGIR